MKKLLLLSVFATLLSCSNDEPTQEDVLDCSCDRVVQRISFNVVNAYPNTGYTTQYKYTTINDCTGIQKEYGLTSKLFQVGDCKQ